MEISASMMLEARHRLKESSAGRSQSNLSGEEQTRFPVQESHPSMPGTGSISAIFPSSCRTSCCRSTWQPFPSPASNHCPIALSLTWISLKDPTWDMLSSGLSSLQYWASATHFMSAGKKTGRAGRPESTLHMSNREKKPRPNQNLNPKDTNKYEPSFFTAAIRISSISPPAAGHRHPCCYPAGAGGNFTGERCEQYLS